MSLIGYLCKKEFIQDCRCDACRKTLPEKTYEELTELKRQNEIMGEALEFYADIANWYSEEHYRSLTCIKDDYTTHKNGYGLAGKRAREALAKCGKITNKD